VSDAVISLICTLVSLFSSPLLECVTVRLHDSVSIFSAQNSDQKIGQKEREAIKKESSKQSKNTKE
jgi:hypothetical protein